MAKRKLNRRQAWRIKKVQEERVSRAKRKAQQAEAKLHELDSQEAKLGLLISHFGATVEVEDENGRPWRCQLRQNLGAIAVGDRVVWQPIDEENGVVTAVEPRTTLLERPDSFGQRKLLAANVNQILVVIAPQPHYSLDNLDQYLIAAERVGIVPVIVFNKYDLLAEADIAQVEQDLQPYRTIGYQVVNASSKSAHGLDRLETLLAGHTSVFAGQSGVGKSSLINALIPGLAIESRALSERSGLGQHTTSAARLYHLPHGGDLIDSPGVREFALWPMPRLELESGFPEFAPYLGYCRFRDCRHLNEPGCALQQAVKEGAVERRRLASFQRLAEAMEEQRFESTAEKLAPL